MKVGPWLALALASLAGCGDRSRAVSSSTPVAVTRSARAGSAADVPESSAVAKTPIVCTAERALARLDKGTREIPGVTDEINAAFAGKWSRGVPTAAIWVSVNDGATSAQLAELIHPKSSTEIRNHTGRLRSLRLEFDSTDAAVVAEQKALCMEEVWRAWMERAESSGTSAWKPQGTCTVEKAIARVSYRPESSHWVTRYWNDESDSRQIMVTLGHVLGESDESDVNGTFEGVVRMAKISRQFGAKNTWVSDDTMGMEFESHEKALAVLHTVFCMEWVSEASI